MDITVYLPDDLGKWAKDRDLPLSRMLREAVTDEKRRRNAVAAELGKASTHELYVTEPDGYGGSEDLTVRLHGTVIAEQHLGGHGTIRVYLGQDEKIYVHDPIDDELHRDVEPDDLRELVDEAAYVDAMRALGEDVVIDVGLPD